MKQYGEALMFGAAMALLSLVIFGCDTPKQPEDKTDTTCSSERYADFAHFTSSNWTWPKGDYNQRRRDSVKVTIVPYRSGAYRVEASGQGSVLAFSATEAETLEVPKGSTTQPSRPNYSVQFGAITEFVVLFSDGKSIERTVVKVP
jgi:hypothetical protein